LLKDTGVRFFEVKWVFLDIFHNLQQQEIRVRNIRDQTRALGTLIISDFNEKQGYGILFRRLQCFICKRLFHEKEEAKAKIKKHTGKSIDWSKQDIKIFTCMHTFHDRCVTKFYEFS